MLCRHETAGQPLPGTRGRRAAVIPVMAACLLLVSVFVLFFQVQSFLGHLETRMVAGTGGGDARLRAIGRQMEILRSKFHGVLADSVEMRLKALEQSIDAGKVVAEDFRAFEQLQKDLELLENYLGGAPAAALDSGQREHGRYRPLPQGEPAVGEGEMLRELSALKTLFYFCLAGLATSTVAMLGYYWVFQRGVSRRIDTAVGRFPALTRPSSDNGG